MGSRKVSFVSTVRQLRAPQCAHNYPMLINALCDIGIMTRPASARLTHTVTTLRLDHLMLTENLLSSFSIRGREATMHGNGRRQCQYVCLASVDVLFSLRYCSLKMQSGMY